MRFLIALFLVFLTEISYASKTYYYYSTPSNFCSSVPDTVCQSYNSSDSVSSLTYAGQYNINNNEGYLTCGFNSVQFDYFGPGKDHSQYFQPPFPNIAHALKNQIVCADDETMELNGCTATCVSDPCKPFKDQESVGLVTCGTASCPSPTTFEGNAQIGMGCTGGAKTQIIPSPSASAVINGCAATLKAGQALPTSAKIKTSAAGSSSTMSYCEATYVYTGASANPNVTPSDLVSLSFGGVTATTENGQCPDGTVKGQLNNSWVCVADSNKGTNAGCPTGQIKDNQGQCVPFAEAGTGSGSGSGSGSGDGGGGGTCDPTKSICEGSGDGSASTGGIDKPSKIENTVTESWWESEYEDGMTGVWNKHKESFQSTPFVQQLNEMKNGAPNSGTCPSFDFQFLQYGGTLQPPCLIWPALKAFFLFMTLMLCRRIIFGG